MGTRLINIIAKDGCYYQDELESGLTNKEIVERVNDTACKEIKEIYDEHWNLIWRERLTQKLANGKYVLANKKEIVAGIELAIQKLGKFEDEEEGELGL